MSEDISKIFKTDVRDYVALDDKKRKAKELLKRMDVKHKEIGNNIVNYMKENNLHKKEIKINNSRLHCFTSTKTTPLTKKFIREQLSNYFKSDRMGKQVSDFIYDPRKKIQACLHIFLDNEEEAKKATNYIFQKRVVDEKVILKRKKQRPRKPVVIANGPISQGTENTMRTPDATESEETESE